MFLICYHPLPPGTAGTSGSQSNLASCPGCVARPAPWESRIRACSLPTPRDKVYKDVGNTRQLFIDDDVVAVVKNVTRRQHTPRKHPANPIYKNDKPWEVVTYFRTSNFSVVRDPLDGLFKCWVQDFHDYFTVPGVPYERSRIYYAQSEDGPQLGKNPHSGCTTWTVTIRTRLSFRPTRPVSPPSART